MKSFSFCQQTWCFVKCAIGVWLKLKTCLCDSSGFISLQVDSWSVGSRGLLYDREWMIVTSSGVCVNQKRQTKLALIQPSIDMESGLMVLHCPGNNSFHLVDLIWLE